MITFCTRMARPRQWSIQRRRRRRRLKRFRSMPKAFVINNGGNGKIYERSCVAGRAAVNYWYWNFLIVTSKRSFFFCLSLSSALPRSVRFRFVPERAPTHNHDRNNRNTIMKKKKNGNNNSNENNCNNNEEEYRPYSVRAGTTAVDVVSTHKYWLSRIILL